MFLPERQQKVFLTPSRTLYVTCPLLVFYLAKQRVEVLEMICTHCASPSSLCSDKSLRQRQCIPDILHLTPISFVNPWCHMGTQRDPVPLFIKWPDFSKESTTGFPLSCQGHASYLGEFSVS